jgi:glycerol-3-phosphate dehydrogenase
MHTPERICIELLLDAQSANPKAQALNYTSAHTAAGAKVTLKDQLSGETFGLQPKVVINAAGPWIDFANARMGLNTNLIGGTKGSHLILDNPELRAAIGENEFFFENKDGRIVLIYPLKERVMVGTSDIPIENPDEARCTEEEIDYFIEMVKVVFPDIPIKRDQIVFQFSGVRPLPTSDSDSPGQISRDHSIAQAPTGIVNFPVYSLVGGKWTSFRAFSEEAANVVLDALNHPRRTSTRTLAIGGGREYPKDSDAQDAWVENRSQTYDLPRERIWQLFERYGTRAEAIADYIAREEDSTLNFLPEYSRREIEFITKEEQIVHLDDFFLRRSMLAKLGHLSHASMDEVAKIIGESLGWSAERADEEIKRAYQILREQHGVQL